MNKKTEQELSELLVSITNNLKGTSDILVHTTDNLEGTIENQLAFSKLLDRIVSLIEFLMRSVSVIFFILTLLIWRVFLWAPISNFLDRIAEVWSSMSEGYQILILGFFGTITASIVARVVGDLFLAKIKNMLKRE